MYRIFGPVQQTLEQFDDWLLRPCLPIDFSLSKMSSVAHLPTGVDTISVMSSAT